MRNVSLQVRTVDCNGSRFIRFTLRNESTAPVQNLQLTIEMNHPYDLTTSQDIPIIQPGESLSFDWHHKYCEVGLFSKRKISIELNGDPYEYVVTSFYGDQIVNGKAIKTKSHMLQFLWHYRYFFLAILLVESGYLASGSATVPAVFSIAVRPLTNLYLWLLLGFFWLPVILYVCWLIIVAIAVQDAMEGPRASGYVSPTGYVNLHVYNRNSRNVEVLSDLADKRNLRHIFLYGFYLNILLITYVIHSLPWQNVDLTFYQIKNFIFGWFRYFFSIGPIITTGYKNINLVLHGLQYLLLLVLPFFMAKITMKRFNFLHKILVNLFMGTIFVLFVKGLAAWLLK